MKTFLMLTALAFAAPLVAHAEVPAANAAQQCQQVYHTSFAGTGATAQNVH